jgi:hypothetical protein
MTKKVINEFKKLNCTTSFILSGRTGFVQVLDVSLNKTLKALVAEAAEDYADKYAELYEDGKFSVGDRRVLLTKWVAAAWKRLHVEYKQVIINTFWNVGLSLNPNGSEDYEIKIKDLDGIMVGDYSRKDADPENGLSSLTPTDLVSVEAAQAKLAAGAGLLEGVVTEGVQVMEEGSDVEEHEECQTLSRMVTQGAKRTRYFTA